MLDLSKFERRHDFDLVTQALGTVRCGTLTAGMLSELAKPLKKQDEEALVLSRKILGMVGSREILPSGDSKAQAAGLANEDIQKITNDEVETFSWDFVVHNDWLLHSYDGVPREITTNEKGEKRVTYTPKVSEFPKNEGESNSQYLIRVLHRYLDEQSKRMKKILEPALLASGGIVEQYKKLKEAFPRLLGNGFAGSSAIEALRKNISLSDQLQDTIKAFKQNTIDQELARIKIEHEPIPLQPLRIPENPIVETNKRLGNLLDQMGEMRVLAAKSAELIGSLNQTALKMQAAFLGNARSTQRSALIAIGLAVLSLLVSSCFSWLSYHDGIEQSKKNDAQIKLFQDEVRNLITAQEKDRAVLVNALKNLSSAGQAKPDAHKQPSKATQQGPDTKGNVTP